MQRAASYRIYNRCGKETALLVDIGYLLWTRASCNAVQINAPTQNVVDHRYVPSISLRLGLTIWSITPYSSAPLGSMYLLRLSSTCSCDTK